MKNTLTTLFLTFISMCLQAQGGLPTCGINYDYDNAGNRIKRYVCIEAFGLTEEEHEELKRSSQNNIKDEETLVVFPNPTSGELRVSQEHNLTEQAQVYFLDALGRQIREDFFGDGRFNISSFTEGNYIMIIVSDNKLYVTKIYKTIR